MSEWPRYESHKIVQALPIIAVLDDMLLLSRVGEKEAISFVPTEPAMLKRAEIGGYAVIYEGGFQSVSPKKAFEDGYTRVAGDPL
jgi:hypothetical protein